MWMERCNFLKLGEYKRCFAVPVTHRLAARRTLGLRDFHGEILMMVKRGDSPINDREREEMARDHPQIRIVDAPHFCDITVYTRAVRTGRIRSTIECWSDIHPALVTTLSNWQVCQNV
jgi:hypothetical protein